MNEKRKSHSDAANRANEPRPGQEGRNDEWWENFRNLLDDQYDWPAEYTFKFVARKEQVEAVREALGDVPVKIRASSKGTYHSVTAILVVESADAVIETYEAVSRIEGVVSL